MRMLKSGKIILGTQAVACTVRNLSDTGACLEFAGTFGIPGTFEFVLPERCHRVRQLPAALSLLPRRRNCLLPRLASLKPSRSA